MTIEFPVTCKHSNCIVVHNSNEPCPLCDCEQRIKELRQELSKTVIAKLEKPKLDQTMANMVGDMIQSLKEDFSYTLAKNKILEQELTATKKELFETKDNLDKLMAAVGVPGSCKWVKGEGGEKK